jgi:hypothetical protein
VHRLAVASRSERVGSSRPVKGTEGCERERGDAGTVVELLIFYTRHAQWSASEGGRNIIRTFREKSRRPGTPRGRCAGPGGPPYPMREALILSRVLNTFMRISTMLNPLLLCPKTQHHLRRIRWPHLSASSHNRCADRIPRRRRDEDILA